MVFRVLVLVAFALFFFGAPTPVEGRNVSISNVAPRRDASGVLMDLHDGVILEVNGTFFYWGMSYGPCNITADGCAGLWLPPHCGYRTDHNLSLYVSEDLVSWRFALDALPMAERPVSVYYRPQVVYNARSGLFVLWINRVDFWNATEDPDYFNATYLVATTASPLAPFVVARASAATRYGGLGVGDVSLFVDAADGGGYVAYAAWLAGVHGVSVERLAPDFLSSLGATNATLSSGVITPSFYEAPLLFERGGVYYLVAGPTCCFCREGAASRVWTAPSPLGPFADSARYIDPPGAANASLLGAQSSLLVHAPLANGSVGIVYAADRWASAPDGLFGHNLQFWGLLEWDDTARPPLPAQLAWQNTLDLDLR